MLRAWLGEKGKMLENIKKKSTQGRLHK